MRTYSQRYDGTIYFYGISAFRFVLRLERRGVGIINAEKNATAYFLRRVIPFFFVVVFFSPFLESLGKVATLNFHVLLNASWLVGGALPLFNWNEYLASRRERQTILRFWILLWSLVKLLNLLFTQFLFLFSFLWF